MGMKLSVTEMASLSAILPDEARALVDRPAIILACARRVIEARGGVFDPTMKLAGGPPSYNFKRGNRSPYCVVSRRKNDEE